MIRRKKTEEEIKLTPLEEEKDLDLEQADDWKMDDLDELDELPEDEDDKKKKKKKKKHLKFPWRKKKSEEEADVEEDAEETGSEEVDSEEIKDEESQEEAKEAEESGDVSEKQDSSDSEKEKEDFDPLNLEEDGVEYIKMDDEKKMSPKKIVAIVAAVVVVLAVGITLLVKNINSGDSGKAYVQSVAVLAGLGTANGESNRYTGIVEAQESWKITLDGDMSVEECYVNVGDEVKKGDKLFIYNTEELKLNQEKKELEVETMENEITQLTKDITSYENDLKSADSSTKIELQTQILTAQTTIKKDEYSIKSGKEEIEKIKKNIEDATVTSKMDGVVKSINKSLGESSSDSSDDVTADATATGEDSSVYMTILSIGDYRVKGKVSETNINSLEEGDRMIIRSRVGDTTWTGVISQLKTDETATSDEGDTSSSMNLTDEDSSTDMASQYYFYVEMDSTDGLLMGQHVFVEPDNGQDDEKDGIWISSAYVVVDEDSCYVWADKNGHLEKREVEVGEYDEVLDEYQILSGIDTTDYIACDEDGVRSGMKTTKVDPYSEESDEESEGDDGSYDMEGSDGLSDDMEDDISDDLSGDMGDDFSEDSFEMEQ